MRFQLVITEMPRLGNSFVGNCRVATATTTEEVSQMGLDYNSNVSFLVPNTPVEQQSFILPSNSECDLESFAGGVASSENGWVDKRELNHR